MKIYETLEELKEDIQNVVTYNILLGGHHGTGIKTQNHRYYWRWIYIEIERLKRVFPDIEEKLIEWNEETFGSQRIGVNPDEIYPFLLQQIYDVDILQWQIEVRERVEQISEEIELFIKEKVKFYE